MTKKKAKDELPIQGNGWRVDEDGRLWYECMDCGFEMSYMGVGVNCEECDGPMEDRIPKDIIKNYKPIAVFLMLSYVSRKCIFKENNVKHELYDKEQLFDKNFLTNLEKNYKSQVNYLTKETREKNVKCRYE